MKKRIVVVTATLIIIFLIILYIKEIRVNIDGWEQFKDGAVDNYNFVNDVEINRNTPVQLDMDYNVNKKLDDKEINELFNYTISYISKEQTFLDLVNYQRGSDPYSFHIINIRIYYSDEGNPYIIELTSHQSETGEPKFEYYKKWDINYDNEIFKEYICLSQFQE